MNVARGRPSKPLRRWDEDRGVSLTELLVYMIILGFALAIALAAVVQMVRVLTTTTDVTDASTTLWKATSLLDRQVRNANAINVPGARGSSPAGQDPAAASCNPDEECFVEFRTTKAGTYSPQVCPGCAATAQVCTQWWTDPGTGRVLWRWWEDTDSPTRSAPIVAVDNLVPNATAPAFAPRFGDALVGTFPLQALAVNLTTQEGDQVSRRETSYTARNSKAFYEDQVAADWGLSACRSVNRAP